MYHIAELNIARLVAPLDSPEIADFVNGLAQINALAESTPGFVWRLTAPAGDPSLFEVFNDERIIVNMSVWESIEALHEYTYYSDHTDFYRRRKEWFSHLETASFVMWWVPAGHIPTVEEAKAKLEQLDREGPTAEAFTFRQRFPAPIVQPT